MMTLCHLFPCLVGVARGRGGEIGKEMGDLEGRGRGGEIGKGMVKEEREGEDNMCKHLAIAY